MTLRCPVCRADNTTGPACRRCRADLSLLIAIESRRDFHLTQAQIALASGDQDVAAWDIGQAESLRAGPDVQRLRACHCILNGDFGTAVAIHAKVAGRPID